MKTKTMTKEKMTNIVTKKTTKGDNDDEQQ